MGAPEVEGYLSDLAVERHVSASTQNQASRRTWKSPCRGSHQLGHDGAFGLNPCEFVRISPELRAQAGSQRPKWPTKGVK